MKRTVLVLIAALVLLPFAFASGAKEGAATAGKKFRVAISLPPANNAWQAKMLDSVNAEVAKDTEQLRVHGEERRG